MSQPPSSAPAGNQFSLRGLFILITAVSVILAALALCIRQPYQWLGALGILAFCLAVIGLLELCRKLFPPKPRPHNDLARRPLGSMHAQGGENPFAPQSGPGESPFGPPPQNSAVDG